LEVVIGKEDFHRINRFGTEDTVTQQGPQPTCTPPPNKTVTFPADGESITSMATNNTYKIGQKIGEGSFGIVYECFDVWNNDLAVKVMKPKGSYEDVRKSTEAEFGKLRTLRHPFVTYVFDAFEYPWVNE
jgi:serine/threonine protein kinase